MCFMFGCRYWRNKLLIAYAIRMSSWSQAKRLVPDTPRYRNGWWTSSNILKIWCGLSTSADTVQKLAVMHVFEAVHIVFLVNIALPSIFSFIFVFRCYPTLKQSVISPLLKKATLDKDQLSNYRPISNLSLLSKIIGRVVKSRLTHHISSNNLFNPNQSAYCKHHSTETALLYIHDYLINAVDSQSENNLSRVYVFFDTTDHSILITRLSS